MWVRLEEETESGKDDEEFIVARALLPENIDEGTKLLFENFVYEIIA